MMLPATMSPSAVCTSASFASVPGVNPVLAFKLTPTRQAADAVRQRGRSVAVRETVKPGVRRVAAIALLHRCSQAGRPALHGIACIACIALQPCNDATRTAPLERGGKRLARSAASARQCRTRNRRADAVAVQVIVPLVRPVLALILTPLGKPKALQAARLAIGPRAFRSSRRGGAWRRTPSR